MLFSRWKVMTGVIGVSIGGLAALASQNPRPDVVASAPMIPAAKPTSAPLELPPPAATYATPVSADLLPSLPVIPPTVPTMPTIELPALPETSNFEKMLPKKPQEVKLPPTKPAELPVLPVSGVFPTPVFFPDAAPIVPPATSVPSPSSVFTAPPSVKPTTSAPATPIVPSIPPIALTPPTIPTTPAITITPVETPLPVVDLLPPVTPKPVAVAVVASKFRIVLRVGEGEPTFEVRHNDDLVMKVACDKVDIKSPEKGTGPSNVIATGKVRFVGFGAEGTCDSLSFLSGTGEVSLAGNVNVKVRDKIGRVESELNADKMQYKLDSTALTGVLKP